MSIDTRQIKPNPRKQVQQGSDPAFEASHGTYFVKEVSGVAEFHYIDSSGNVTQITTGGSVNLPALPSLLPAGGDSKSILNKVSGTDYDTQWSKHYQVAQERFFTLPAGADIVARILAKGSISGTTLDNAQNLADPEFDNSVGTLTIEPVGLTGIVMTELKIFEETTTGATNTRGWNPFAFTNWKTNTAKTHAALIDIEGSMDPAKRYMFHCIFRSEDMS